MGDITELRRKGRRASFNRVRQTRDAFTALFCVSSAVLCVLTALVFFGSAVSGSDVGEEEYSIALGAVLVLLGVGLSVLAARSLMVLLRAPGAVTVLVTLAMVFIWVGLTVASYQAGSTSASERPSGLIGLAIASGLTIPAAAISVIGLVGTTVLGTFEARK